MLSCQLFSLAVESSLTVPSRGFCKPGELASFYCCQQGLFLSSKGVYLLSHIFVCLVFNVRNAGESPEAFRFKCLYASLCIAAEGGYNKSSIEFKQGFVADLSVIPGFVMTLMGILLLALLTSIFFSLSGLPYHNQGFYR